ncbi:alpha-galactosidase [Chitinophaga sp. 22321]|uniref:Alpha-galactosidase n=1 Tax=Chitinophaga hostae TaxID=2831022 RepID=A0ABS5IXM3_9BACT|nr:alpha-galactosidase [Chitinophaga hostae]MBS0027699.1 alpha-galactosidase [Chitinophaga hostae]
MHSNSRLLMFIIFFLSLPFFLKAEDNHCIIQRQSDSVFILKNARVTLKGPEIIASTGKIARAWKLTGQGLQTISLQDLRKKREFAVSNPKAVCDWDLPGAINDTSTAEWLKTTVSEDDDEGFSNRHLQIISEFRYPYAKLMLQYVVWVYPDAVGMRTQIRVKAMPGFDPVNIKDDEGIENRFGNNMATPGPRCDYLPLNFKAENQRRYWGYYNNPGGRHDPSRLMLEEKIVTGYPLFLTEDNDWASGISVEYNQGSEGVCVVKESPKCVNQKAHYTGSFYSSPIGLSVTGWGLSAKEILPERYRECWATWIILWDGGNDGMQLALKKFDRARYPVFPDRDMFLLSNTWGPANPDGAQFTDENYLMKEIPALANVGVELMQIDDGWQKGGRFSDAKGFTPKYKNGWKDLKAKADEYKLRFGLWATAQYVTTEELRKNVDELGFVSWKMDFDHLKDRKDYEDRTQKYRDVMKYAPMKTQFTLCPEYDDPRYGWYYFKEYGSIYFQNIQEGLPEHLTMVPYQVLMQHWLMSKYFNSNKLQVLLQNPKRSNGDRSDAPLHSHSYCFAMGLPFVPCFFQSAQYLDSAGTRELKDFIALYKRYRKSMFTAYTFPIGHQPDNESWSGFQMVSEEGLKDNYLLLFREINNQEAMRKVKLKFLAGKMIKVSNLKTGQIFIRKVGNAGLCEFSIKHPADFLLLKYEVIAN